MNVMNSLSAVNSIQTIELPPSEDKSLASGASSEASTAHDENTSSASTRSGSRREDVEEEDLDMSALSDGEENFMSLMARKPAKIFEIDYIGGDTFRVSQTNLLKIKSVELFQDSQALLSARGLTHRSSELFKRELKNVSQVIGHTKTTTGTNQPTHLFQPYFQRALAYERLNQINKAIKDYTSCIIIKPACSEAYFNRSGLYQLKGNSTDAIKDLNEAIRLEPLNANYRRNRSLLLREIGDYKDAVSDSRICKMLDKKKHLKGGYTLAEVMRNNMMIEDEDTVREEDPIIVALKLPPRHRSLYHLIPIVEFIQTMKMFANLTQGMKSKMAAMFTLQLYETGEEVFNEGDPGDRFYIILEGEVAIYKNIVTKNVFGDDMVDSKTLVKLVRGQAFGETALESEAGVRTAGARACGFANAKLMVLTAEQYKSTLTQFKSSQNAELLRAMNSCGVFKHWDQAKIETLAVHAIERSYSADIELLHAGDLVRYLFIVKCGIVKIVKRIPKPAKPPATCQLPRLQNLRKGVMEEPPGLWILGHRDSERGNAEQIMRRELEDRASQIRIDHRRTSGLKMGGSNSTPTTPDKEEKSPVKKYQLPTSSDGNNDGDMVDFNVGVLGSGQIFGEMCILQPETPSPATVISCTGVELYCFEKDQMLSMGIKYDSASIMALDESLRLHDPPVDKIQYFYRSKFEWEQRKRAALKNLKL